MKFFQAVLFGTVLLASVSLSAQDRKNGADRQQPQGSNRPEAETGRGAPGGSSRAYYDSKHRDWHQSNDQENQSYSRYAEQHHWKDRDLSSSNEKEQQQYWSWRHKHPDSH